MVLERVEFVYDFSLSCSSSNLASMERQLQLCLNMLKKMAEENGFKFSKTKTAVKKLHPDPTLTIYNSQSPDVSQIKSNMFNMFVRNVTKPLTYSKCFQK